MLRFLAALLAACSLYGQTAPAPAQTDPLGRSSPQSAILHFLEACDARDYEKASHYLDLQQVPAADRAQQGPALAQQLADLLDQSPFDIAALSSSSEGDENSGLAPNQNRLVSFTVNGQPVTLYLQRVTLRNNLRGWEVAPASVADLPQIHQLISETPLEKKLPQFLVTIQFLATPIWRWIVLLAVAIGWWFAARPVARVLVAILRPLINDPALRGPMRFLLAAGGLYMALDYFPPSPLPRLFIERGLGLIFSLALAWGLTLAIDFLAERWHAHLNPRVQAISFSILPLGRQLIKLTLLLIAILTVVSAWGYNTSAIIAGLGVGGLAVALAAQKTLENLFGGISVIGDRPVLVGDVCRFDGRTGTVMKIGLRSTRIRTTDRTVISVPNGQFSTMSLENLSIRDKVWFNPKLSLRRDTTPEQLREVLRSIGEILAARAKVEVGKIPVRFINVGAYSLDIEVAAHITTTDSDEFLAIQQELLIEILQAVEQAGTALAVPLQESAEPRRR